MRIVSVIAWAALASCSAHAPSPPPAPDMGGVMRIWGRYGMAHACPCDGVILTAAHVVQPFATTASPLALTMMSYAWSDGLGNFGVMTGVGAMSSRDIGIFEATSGTPAYYSHALAEPEIGSTVWWKEYDRSSVAKAYQPKVRHAEVVNLVSGHIVFDSNPIQGASGGCLFDSARKVVGIPIWDDRISAEAIGIAASVAGRWWLMP